MNNNTLEGNVYYLKFYRSYYDAIKGLPQADRVAMYDALMAYAFDSLEPNFKNKTLEGFWLLIEPNINSSIANAKKQSKGGKAKAAKPFTPPTVEEVAAYCEEAGLYDTDPEKFCDYYESIGWTKRNGAPIKDWKACARTWNIREYDI